MTTTTWTNPAGGDFNTPSNWNNGVPGSGDTALITLKGTYTVTSSQMNTIAALDLQKRATLDIASTSNAFLLGFDTTGTVDDTLAGTTTVADGAELVLGGEFPDTATNINFSGSINIESGAVANDLTLVNIVAFTGKGTINLLGDNAGIITHASTDIFANDSGIAGAGSIGGGSFAMDLNNESKGVIDADNPTFQLRLNVSSASQNYGLIEATNSGSLALEGDGFQQFGKGQIKAAAGSAIFVADGFVLSGGAVSIAKGGQLAIDTAGTILTAKPLANAGTINVLDSFFTVNNIKNAGTGVLIAGENGFIDATGNVAGGSIEIEDSSGVSLGGGSTKIIFESGSTGTLTLDNPKIFTGNISGMAANPGASIILANMEAADDPSLSYAKGVLTVTGAVTHVVDKIKIVAGGTFSYQPSSGGFVQIFDPPANLASVPDGSAAVLAQAMASFGVAGAVAALPTPDGADHHRSSAFLAPPHLG